MSNFSYDDRFKTVAGTTIDGSDFDDLFEDLQTHIATKVDRDGDTYSGTHTFNGPVVYAGTFDATGVTTALFAAITATAVGVVSLTASGAIAGATLAGAADTTDITGGTWT